MQDWIELKQLIAASVTLDAATLRVIASVPALVALALLFRKPITHGVPWLALLALVLANEAVDALADRMLEDWEIQASARDLALAMVLPSFLMIACRIRSLLPTGRAPKRTIWLTPAPAPARRPDPIVDAEFEEIH